MKADRRTFRATIFAAGFSGAGEETGVEETGGQVPFADVKSDKLDLSRFPVRFPVLVSPSCPVSPLARQVGVPRLVVFVNKVDLVDDPELIELETRELLTRYGFDGEAATFVRGSARGALASPADPAASAANAAHRAGLGPRASIRWSSMRSTNGVRRLTAKHCEPPSGLPRATWRRI